MDETPEEIWHRYNKRADIENRIDEIKEGIALNKTSQKSFDSNQFLSTMKTIAYNLIQGFKYLLPMDMLSYEVATVRREFIQQAGNVCGKGKTCIVGYQKLL